MPKLLRLRVLSEEEEVEITRLARSRTAPVRLAERARIVERARQGLRVPAIAAAVGVSEPVVRTWLHRFNAHGLAGLTDAPRAGRPATYPAEQVGELIAASLTDPQGLGLPFGSWTLDRLATYLHESKGITMKRSRIGEILQAEGLRWRQQESWFGERPDPAFAAKSNGLECQAGMAGGPGFQAVRWRSRALRMVRSLCMQAVRATFFGLPAASSRA